MNIILLHATVEREAGFMMMNALRVIGKVRLKFWVHVRLSNRQFLLLYRRLQEYENFAVIY